MNNVGKYSHDTKSTRNCDEAIKSADRSLYGIVRTRKTNRVYLGSLNFGEKQKRKKTIKNYSNDDCELNEYLCFSIKIKKYYKTDQRGELSKRGRIMTGSTNN